MRIYVKSAKWSVQQRVNTLLKQSLLFLFLMVSLHRCLRASQVVLVVKNPPANAENVGILVRSLGRQDALEDGMATHSSILLENPMDRGAWWVQSMGSQRIRHN